MSEYRAIYKCRLCGEEYADSLISEHEAEKCFEKFEKGKSIYRSISGRNDIPKVKVHICNDGKDGSFGLSDFIGMRKVE